MLISTISSFVLLAVTTITLLESCVAREAATPKDVIQALKDELSEIFIDTPMDKEEMLKNNKLEKYENEREAIIEEEELLSTGGSIKLTDKERQVNDIFMHYKLLELSDGFENAEKHAAGMHFFKAKPLIEASNVFKILKEMPKGAILHAHNTAAVSSEWVIRNLTYIPGMLQCINNNRVTIYTFRESPKHKCRTKYRNIENDRAKVTDVSRYDKVLETQINLHTKFPEIQYNSIDTVWRKFQNMFDTLGDVLKYVPAYKAFHWRLLEEMYDDNVFYAEIRMRFKELYDEDSNATITIEDSVEYLIDIVEEFKELHPDFLGIKVIYATYRGAKKKDLLSIFGTFKQLHNRYPDFIIGFDLVGQEDKGKTLHTFVDVLQDFPKTAKYFFHAGETNWYGSSTDLNLLDAILMNTTRIGHGFALLKHPILSDAVKERDIAIEVSPISNQVLNLVSDLRNHPAGFFISENIPMVISNDDPGFWNAKGLSYDFYYAIMSFAPVNAGLKTLKHLVWNSIKYSSLNENERNIAYDILQQSWDEFLDRVIEADAI